MQYTNDSLCIVQIITVYCTRRPLPRHRKHIDVTHRGAHLIRSSIIIDSDIKNFSLEHRPVEIVSDNLASVGTRKNLGLNFAVPSTNVDDVELLHPEILSGVLRCASIVFIFPTDWIRKFASMAMVVALNISVAVTFDVMDDNTRK